MPITAINSYGENATWINDPPVVAPSEPISIGTNQLALASTAKASGVFTLVGIFNPRVMNGGQIQIWQQHQENQVGRARLFFDDENGIHTLKWFVAAPTGSFNDWVKSFKQIGLNQRYHIMFFRTLFGSSYTVHCWLNGEYFSFADGTTPLLNVNPILLRPYHQSSTNAEIACQHVALFPNVNYTGIAVQARALELFNDSQIVDSFTLPTISASNLDLVALVGQEGVIGTIILSGGLQRMDGYQVTSSDSNIAISNSGQVTIINSYDFDQTISVDITVIDLRGVSSIFTLGISIEYLEGQGSGTKWNAANWDTAKWS